MWIDEFDKAWDEGTMFLLTMHLHVSGHRSRIVALEGLIEHMKVKVMYGLEPMKRLHCILRSKRE